MTAPVIIRTLAIIDCFTTEGGTSWERDLIAVIRKAADTGLVVRVETTEAADA